MSKKEWRPIDILIMHLGADHDRWVDLAIRDKSGVSSEIVRIYKSIILKAELIAEGKEQLIK